MHPNISLTGNFEWTWANDYAGKYRAAILFWSKHKCFKWHAATNRQKNHKYKFQQCIGLNCLAYLLNPWNCIPQCSGILSRTIIQRKRLDSDADAQHFRKRVSLNSNFSYPEALKLPTPWSFLIQHIFSYCGATRAFFSKILCRRHQVVLNTAENLEISGGRICSMNTFALRTLWRKIYSIWYINKAVEKSPGWYLLIKG